MNLLIVFFSIFTSFFNPFVGFDNYDVSLPVKWENKVYKKGIETVLIHKKGWELSMPVIELEKEDQISLQFDELGTEIHDYSYTVIHCNSKWEQSDLNPIEYIEGYQELDIDTYSFSQNTLVNYINYSIDFPNDDLKLGASGNYVVKVYERNNPENLVLVRRFYVLEKMVKIDAHLEKMNVKMENGQNQRLNIELDCGYEIENPSETITLKVEKNSDVEKDFTDLKPSFIDGNILRYKTINKLAFTGGNEYRHFDIKNFRFISDRILNVDKKTGIYHVYLMPDKNKSLESYNFKHDLNGRRTVKLESSNSSNIMADYCYVHFQIEAEIPLESGNFYIFGGLTDWAYQKKAKMDYDFETGRFVGKLYLKQGYYNYQYRFKTNDKMLDNEEYASKLEGNFFQTENEYHLFVYYNDYGTNYEKLVGYDMINSTKNANY